MTHLTELRDPKKRFHMRKIYGDCLEGEPVYLVMHRKGVAIIEHGLVPRIGDLVHCSSVSGQLGGFIKRVESINNGIYTVGTCYVDKSRDFSFEAAEIFGVVKEVYDELLGNRIYCREGAE